MISFRLKKLKNKFSKLGIDGYIIPKNDEFFSEYSNKDRLNIISNFTGSAGFAIILKKKNYLFVDGRYTLQAQIESGENFKIVDLNRIINCNLFKKITIGFDPKLFTSNQISKFFDKFNKVKKISVNLIDMLHQKKISKCKPFFSLDKKIAGLDHHEKIKAVSNFLKKNKSDYIFISASENVAWLLNIRGNDNPYSPIPNSHLLLDSNKNYFLITDTSNTSKILKEGKLKKSQIVRPNEFLKLVKKINKKKIIIDNKTCSVFYEDIFKSKFKVLKKEDPIYLMKSIKNKFEIKNMINAHIYDGVALTKFLYWIKNLKKFKFNELYVQKKLENFRKQNKNYLYPSFNTIAGSGPNGAIIHYRATKKNTRKINKNEIFLCDSGGQYKYGTTDVTRTVCFNNPKQKIKSIFTKVLKGHIAVATSNINKNPTGKKIDTRARKFLKDSNLDYEHGTGHGVGFFSNVHEGPQSISKYNKIKLREGMILSNEPGYYQKGQFGIRIENLLYIKKIKKKLLFENLTMAPIDKDLIDFKQLNSNEKNYLFKYHLIVYSKISKYLKASERKWLATFI